MVRRINQRNHRTKGESSPHSSRMGDNQGSYQSWHNYTAKLDKRSINGIQVCTTPAKETPSIAEK
jgi:hypothetical protein